MPKSATKKQRGTIENDTPQQDLIQSTKSTIKEGLRVINNLDHAQRLQRRKSLILCIECSSLLNALLFLSFQIVQRRYRGASRYTIFLFLPRTRANLKASLLLVRETPMTHQKVITKDVIKPLSCDSE